MHTSLLAFHDRLEELADSQDVDRLVAEGEPLRTAVLEDTRRAMSALSLLPSDLQRDPTILPTLHAVQSALPWQLEAITTLAASGDWRAVHLRLANQVRPLESLTSELVEEVDHEAGEQQAQTVRKIERVERLVFLAVPLTAVFTLLIAGTFGLGHYPQHHAAAGAFSRRLQGISTGDFQHKVPVTGRDELADLGRVFNETAKTPARSLRDPAEERRSPSPCHRYDSRVRRAALGRTAQWISSISVSWNLRGGLRRI